MVHCKLCCVFIISSKTASWNELKFGTKVVIGQVVKVVGAEFGSAHFYANEMQLKYSN